MQFELYNLSIEVQEDGKFRITADTNMPQELFEIYVEFILKGFCPLRPGQRLQSNGLVLHVRKNGNV